MYRSYYFINKYLKNLEIVDLNKQLGYLNCANAAAFVGYFASAFDARVEAFVSY